MRLGCASSFRAQNWRALTISQAPAASDQVDRRAKNRSQARSPRAANVMQLCCAARLRCQMWRCHQRPQMPYSGVAAPAYGNMRAASQYAEARHPSPRAVLGIRTHESSGSNFTLPPGVSSNPSVNGYRVRAINRRSRISGHRRYHRPRVRMGSPLLPRRLATSQGAKDGSTHHPAPEEEIVGFKVLSFNGGFGRFSLEGGTMDSKKLIEEFLKE